MPEFKVIPHFYRMEFVYDSNKRAMGEITCDPPPHFNAREFVPVLREFEVGSTTRLKHKTDESWSADHLVSLGFDFNSAYKKYLFLLSGQQLENYDTVNTVRRLWVSTGAFYERFDYDAPVEARIIKFKEENREFLNEVRAVDQGNGSGVALMEEAADVLVTVIGLLQKRGVRLDHFLEQCELVASKNDAKTPETHEIRDGLIARKIAKPAQPGDAGYINLSNHIEREELP